MDLTEKTLRQHIRDGIIQAIQSPTGEILVNENEVKLAEGKHKFDNLRRVPITVTDAATKYKVEKASIRVWVRLGYIKVISPGYRMTIDEADVAYCASIHNEHKLAGSKAPLFDEAERPYQLKHPSLHRYRQRRKTMATA
jgi:predicted site-specific integrase-resolvase